MSTKKLKKKIPNEEKIDFGKKNTIFFKKIEKTENIPSLPRFSSKKVKKTRIYRVYRDLKKKPRIANLPRFYKK